MLFNKVMCILKIRSKGKNFNIPGLSSEMAGF